MSTATTNQRKTSPAKRYGGYTRQQIKDMLRDRQTNFDNPKHYSRHPYWELSVAEKRRENVKYYQSRLIDGHGPSDLRRSHLRMYMWSRATYRDWLGKMIRIPLPLP